MNGGPSPASGPSPPLTGKSLGHTPWLYLSAPAWHRVTNGHSSSLACLLPRSAERTEGERDVKVLFTNKYKARNIIFGNLKKVSYFK